MSDDLRTQIYLNFNRQETEALLEIWRANDRDQWSEVTFDVIQQILQERQFELPSQVKPDQKTVGAHVHSLTSTSHKKSTPKEQPVQLPPQEGMLRLTARRVVDLNRPQTVVYAVYLAYGALVVQVLLLILNLFTSQSSAAATSPQFAVVIAFLLAGYVALQALLIRGAWLGRNVPRILYVGLVLVSLLSVLMSGTWADSFAVQPFRTGLSILTMSVDLVAAVLLMLPDSNAWFREMRRRNQAAQAREPQRPLQRSSSDKWLPSQLRWVPLGLSFVLVLVLNAQVLILTNETNPAGWVKGAYVGPCLPVSAVILAVCAWVGAKIARKDGSNPWSGATIGVWIGAIPAIALSLFALLGIGGGQ